MSGSRFNVAKDHGKLMTLVGTDPARVLRRAGLPADYFLNDSRSVDGRQYFALWEAMFAEANRSDLALDLGGVKFARGPFISALFAFSCSPTIATGLERLGLFKPILCPMRFRINHTDEVMTLTVVPETPDLTIPQSMAAFEMVYFLECCRVYTAEHIIPPVSVGIPKMQDNQGGDMDAYFGVAAHEAEFPTLTLTREDAFRPLITENPTLWAQFEPELNRQLAEQQAGGASLSTRVRNALLEMLPPAGQANVDTVCERLIMSRRSLQRKLKDEGESFQSVLDRTRADLSMHYLRQSDMSVEEISYLLAYRDPPNSFYRAFQGGWTGMTPPSEARGGKALH